MPITIDWGNWNDYRQLWQITEYRDGCVYKTRPIGFVRAGTAVGKDQTVGPLSTTLIGRTIVLLDQA